VSGYGVGSVRQLGRCGVRWRWPVDGVTSCRMPRACFRHCICPAGIPRSAQQASISPFLLQMRRTVRLSGTGAVHSFTWSPERCSFNPIPLSAPA